MDPGVYLAHTLVNEVPYYAVHILSADQFTKQQLEALFARTEQIRDLFQSDRAALRKLHSGKLAALLFYEPSTRTRLSFAAAAAHLGMQTMSTENAREFSSAAKGETIEDTSRVLSQYHPDVVIIRHHETGEVEKASKVSAVPIINAGDGKGEHPTQSLLDVYTIWRHHKKLTGLKIVIGGDLLHGRTARSLAKVLACFEGNHLVFNTIPELQMADDIKEYLDQNGVTYEEESDMKKAFADADVIVCRAGASTVTEIAAVGAAAIFVPFPFAVDDHQTTNARFLVSAGGGWLVQQSDLTPEGLAKMLLNSERTALVDIAEKAKNMQKINATREVVAACEELSA